MNGPNFRLKQLRRNLQLSSIFTAVLVCVASLSHAQSNEPVTAVSLNPPAVEHESSDAIAPEKQAATATAETLICPAPSAFETEVFTLINTERTSRGISALSMDKRLAVAAARLTVDMLANCFLSHTGSDGSSASERISDAGYPPAATGEIAAAGQTSPQQVVNSWMNSTGHRNNILRTSFTHAGVSHASARGTCFLTPFNITVQRHFWNVDFGGSTQPPETGCSADTVAPSPPDNLTIQ